MLKILIIAGVIFAFLFISYLTLWSGGYLRRVTKTGPIIFFGDSLTAGLGAGAGEDFPSVVSKELDLNNVINAGVAGNTSSQALQRLQSDVLDKDPSLVIVEFSGNDFLQEIPPEETIENLAEITQKIKATGAEVILVHIRFPFDSARYQTGFKKIENELHAKVVYNCLDGILSNPNLMSDSIHPNKEGYKLMAERVTKPIRELTNR